MAKDYERAYGNDTLYWGDGPSELVKQFAELAPEGRALDLGMGEGRDALFLAGQGYNVTAVELAASGVEKCRNRAAELGVRVDAVCADVCEFRIPSRRYSIITCISLFQFLSKEESATLVARIVNGLRRGGIMLCQAFTYDDPSYKVLRRKSKEIAAGVFRDSGGNIYSLYDYGEILDLCAALRPIYYREYDYYDTMRGPAHWHGVVDFVGKKL